MIKINELSVGYEKKILIKGINLRIHAGEILTLIGPNGSGKSTILKTITKQLKQIEGSIILLEKNMDSMKDSEIARIMSMVATTPIRPELMSVRDMVATGRYPYTGQMGLLQKTDWDIVDEALRDLRLEEIKDRSFNKISDGQRQRVMLARALCQEPKVLILDEPTSFLDMKYKLEVMYYIKKFAKEKNITVICSLHELDLAKKISDTIVCVDGEKIVKTGTPDEIFTGNFIQRLFGIEEDEFNPLTCTISMKKEKLLTKEENKPAEKKSGTAKVIMVQGTMSNAGKSLIVAGLCRIFKQDGYRVAPFKSQNMALNSFITKEGLEMGRAQVMQAEAAGIEPMVCMNPILLKPTSDQGSQVIVNGEVIGNMRAKKYFEYKKELVPEIEKAFKKLEEYADIIVIEGAGSPAEINLKQNDIVNMGMAKLVDAPVLLVADIDRGGVFAQLLGTLMLLEEEERDRIEGLIINKFRGDKTILDPGIEMLEEKGGKKVTGVVPYMRLSIDDEDSLSERLDKKPLGIINIGVIKTPRISNFTDFSCFEQISGVQVHYIDKPELLDKMDMCIIPGSKNTIGDLRYLRECGLEAAIKKFAREKIVFGICGGYQMLGGEISDPEGVEEGGSIRGMELLDMVTVLKPEKIRTQVSGKLPEINGKLTVLSNKSYNGYEIHMGETVGSDINGSLAVNKAGNVYGSYIHGIFDNGEIVSNVIKTLAKQKKVTLDVDEKADFNAFKESQYDLLAEEMRKYMDMDAVYKMLRTSRI